jgi:hypothetical protein
VARIHVITLNDINTLRRRGLLLEYITLGWNVVGTVIVIAAAIDAHSVALAGFGLDSVVEIGASTVVIWQLRGINDYREKIALRLISVAFFALAIYILAQSAHILLLGRSSGHIAIRHPLARAYFRRDAGACSR